jgi:hypothetical protein
MRIYTCHILLSNCCMMALNFINFCCYQVLFAAEGPLLSSGQSSPVVSKVLGRHPRFKCVGFVREIAKQRAIQPLALVRMQRLFFRIVPKEHENASCRSTPLVKPPQAAGVPMLPGAVHEFA